MMFSNEDIKVAIAKGELIFTPFSESAIRAAGVVLHLGPNLLKPLPGKVVDLKNKVLPEYKTITIRDDEPYALAPSEFILAATYEKVTVGASLGFFIEGRSTLARVGLTIVQTAMLVYPGHKDRPVTLELANHGPNSILLYPKMKIARAVVFELRSPATENYDDYGKYRSQGSVGMPVFENEFIED